MAIDERELTSILMKHLGEGRVYLEVHCDVDMPEDRQDVQAAEALRELGKLEVIELYPITARDLALVLVMGNWRYAPNETWIDLRIKMHFGTDRQDARGLIPQFSKALAPFLSKVHCEPSLLMNSHVAPETVQAG